MRLIGFEAAEKFISASSLAISCGPREAPDAHAPSLVRARPAALLKNMVWTRSLIKLGSLASQTHFRKRGQGLMNCVYKLCRRPCFWHVRLRMQSRDGGMEIEIEHSEDRRRRQNESRFMEDD